MKEELELKLVEKFPELLKDYKGAPHETCLAFGLECDDGWYKVVYNTLDRLNKICELADLEINIAQIKEKFGRLRIYVHMIECEDRVVADIVWAIINDAETFSENVCEVTGEYGSMCKRRSWYKTLSYDLVNKENSEYSEYEPVDERVKKVWDFRKKKDEK